MNKGISVIIICLSCIIGEARAQAGTAGTTSFTFVNLPADARSAAMAGASAAMPNGIYGMRSNPASLGYITTTQAMIGYRNIIDLWSGPVAVARPFGDAGTFGVSFTPLLSGKIPETILNGDGLPEATGNDAVCNYIAGGVSWSRIVWQTVSAGVTVKGLYNYMRYSGTYNSASAIAIDGGVQYRLLRDRFIAGLSFQNLGVMVSSYTDSSERYQLPMGVKAGISFVPRYTPALRFALDVNARRGDYVNFMPAMEIDTYNKFLQIRLGYLFSTEDVREGLSVLQGEPHSDYVKSNWASFCLGAGINTKMENVALHIDLGLEFLDNFSTPSTIVSAFLEF